MREEKCEKHKNADKHFVLLHTPTNHTSANTFGARSLTTYIAHQPAPPLLHSKLKVIQHPTPRFWRLAILMSSSTPTLHSHQISHLIQYRKEPCPLPDSDTETYLSRKERGLSCQLHKLIRSLKSQSPPPLSSLFNNLKANPRGINERNGVGWTVLHLAIYHRVDYEVVEGMLMSVTDELRVKICSVSEIKTIT